MPGLHGNPLTVDHASGSVSRDGECNVDAYLGSTGCLASSRGGRGSSLKLEGERLSAYSMSLQITLSSWVWAVSSQRVSFT